MYKDDMLGKLVKMIVGLPAEMLGTLCDLVEKLGGEDGQCWWTALKRFLRKESPWEAVASLLLEFVDVVDFPGNGIFYASAIEDRFTTNNKVVKIAWVGSDFENNFMSMVEDGQAKHTLRISKLKKKSPNAPIMAELGSNRVVESALADVWELLKKQPDGKPGKLLTSGCENIFYVRDVKRVLWAVHVYWRSVGWHVSAYSVTDPFEWGEGYQVFSRNS